MTISKALAEKVAFSFLRAFGATFLAGMLGLLAVPNWDAGKAALVSLSVAALTAGIRAVQHLLLDAPAA